MLLRLADNLKRRERIPPISASVVREARIVAAKQGWTLSYALVRALNAGLPLVEIQALEEERQRLRAVREGKPIPVPPGSVSGPTRRFYGRKPKAAEKAADSPVVAPQLPETIAVEPAQPVEAPAAAPIVEAPVVVEAPAMQQQPVAAPQAAPAVQCTYCGRQLPRRVLELHEANCRRARGLV